MDRKAQMRELMNRLGGQAVVAQGIGKSTSVLNDYVARGAFSPATYGRFLELGIAAGEVIPRELFGQGADDHWPPVAQHEIQYFGELAA